MAEIAAGAGAAIAAEEIIYHGAQAGVAGYLIAKPTMPLKVTYTMVAYAEDDSTRRSLARSNHTLTVVANKAYIFGGDTAENKLASNDIHVVTLTSSGEPEMDYRLIPALPNEESGDVPIARTEHAACAFNGGVAIYGGSDGKGELIDDGSAIWLFNIEHTTWTSLGPVNTSSAPGPKENSKLFAYGNTFILFGGRTASGVDSDVWQFDTDSKIWSKLDSGPASTSNAAFANGQLYLISGSDPLSSQLHHIDISAPSEERTWKSFTFATNPISPGPRARNGGGMLPITTGYGRNYLVYFLGAREKPQDTVVAPKDETHDVTQWSDMWTLQLPSSDLEAKPKLNIGDAIKPAKIKDAIRSAVGAESGKYAWAEVEVQVNDPQLPEGKLHPGPRGFFGCDAMEDGRSLVLWGGENAKGSASETAGL